MGDQYVEALESKIAGLEGVVEALLWEAGSMREELKRLEDRLARVSAAAGEVRRAAKKSEAG